jgi:hypothetical protein
MRKILGGLVVVVWVGSVAGQGPAQRFGIEPDPKNFPQATPQETLASVVKAIALKRADYFLAHLADPRFVDERLKQLGGNTAELQSDAGSKLLDDPGTAKLLRRFLKDGEWMTTETSATVRLKDQPDRSITFRTMDGRWFMQNQYRTKTIGKER